MTKEFATARESIENLKENSKIIELISEAETGDRPAWDRLNALSQDSNYTFRSRAGRAWESVLFRYGAPTEVRSYPRFPGGLEVNGLSATNATLHQIRIGLPLLSPNTRLETLQFVLFFREVRRTDPRIEVCAWAGRHFNALAPMPGVNPLHDDVMDEWLKENLEKIKD
jgi:hypothetical protein